MKIQLLSDMHLEFLDNPELALRIMYSNMEEKPDAIILAGDIITLVHPDLFKVMEVFTEQANIVYYVPGNHEYYGSSIEAGKAKLDRIGDLGIITPYLYYFDASFITPDMEQEINIYGGTMWFPGGFNPVYKRQLNDFRYISDMDSVPGINKDFVTDLGKSIDSSYIVVTHHLPSYKSVSRFYVGDPLNCFYVSPVDEIIEEKQPRFWFHGHSHVPVDYNIGNTRVISNPLDYPPYWNDNTQIKFNRLIEV